jgi:hypothetical protein
VGVGEAEQTKRRDQRAGRHHHVAAMEVYRAADERRNQSRNKEAERKPAHHERQ